MSIADIRQCHRIFAVFFCLLSLPASADWQSRISAALCSRWQEISGLQAECSVSFPGLSPSFQLPHCDLDWQQLLLRPLQPGRNGLEIQCEQPWWKQNLAVQLHIYTEVAVLAQPVSAGQTLTATDISFVRHDTGALNNGYLTEPAQLLGMEIKRSLRSGTVLNTDMLAPPLLINRGEQLSIRIQRPGIRIEMKGTALEAGRRGQRIRVRNDQAQKTLTAVVIDKGLVQVE